MSVKTIFKVLIGTIVLIVISFLVIEIVNISTNSARLNNITKMAARQSSNLFTQETYKITNVNGDLAGSINMNPVLNSDGVEYVSGTFYSGNSIDAIYDALYTSNEFKNWVKNDNAVVKGNWKSLNLLNKALNNHQSLNLTAPVKDTNMSNDYYDTLVSNFNDSILAKKYLANKITPINMGIPYLDKDTVTRMFKWNLAQLVSNCNSNLIIQDSNGNMYISYNGFRVYASQAYITNLEYKTFDLTNNIDRSYFNQLTNIDPDNIKFDFNAELKGTLTDETKRICLVGISYSVPIAYEGLTPIKKLFNYVINTEVEGLNAKSAGSGSNQSWVDATSELQSGGFNGNTVPSGVLPVPGKLIYYIIR